MNVKDVILKITGKKKLYDMGDHIDNWLEWYIGDVKKFHHYSIYNGRKEIKRDRLTLNMAKRSCEDWANLLLNEKTDITVAHQKSQELLHEVLKDSKFWTRGNEGVEKSFALGIGAFVTTVDNIGTNEQGELTDVSCSKVGIRFINGTKIKPISFENEEITECAFVNVDTEKTYISIHLKNDLGNYEIWNITCDGDADNLSFSDEDVEVFDTQSPLPWYQIIKPNVANNVDINSPLGISIFANAINNLKEIDLVWDSYANEFMLGMKRIFVNAKEWTVDTKTGEERDVFDANDVVIYLLPETDDGKQSITDQTQMLRVADHIAALQNQLNLFGYKCGLGTEHYKFDSAGVATATQIISVNSEMFRNLKKHEILLNDALVGMSKSILYALKTFTVHTDINPDAEITIKFDDSIIIDEATERTQDLVDVNLGVMSKAEYRAKWYNEDLETATLAIEGIDSFTIPDEDVTYTETQTEEV